MYVQNGISSESRLFLLLLRQWLILTRKADHIVIACEMLYIQVLCSLPNINFILWGVCDLCSGLIGLCQQLMVTLSVYLSTLLPPIKI